MKITFFTTETVQRELKQTIEFPADIKSWELDKEAVKITEELSKREDINGLLHTWWEKEDS